MKPTLEKRNWDEQIYALKDKHLLVLATSFPNEDSSFVNGMFVKKQVAELEKFFNRITIISPVFRSFGLLKKDKLCKDYSYGNVEIYYPRAYFIPIFWLSRVVIDGRKRAIEMAVKRHKIRFDLIHAHFTWPSGYIAVKLRKKFHVPVVTTIHENGDWLDKEIEMDNPRLKAAWSKADVLIRVNERDVPVLKRFNENTISIPNGYSSAYPVMDASAARKCLSLSPNAKIIFSLGALIERKGFNHLIDSMASVCAQRDDVFCFIGGSGKEQERLQEQIDRLHLADKVRLIGTVSDDELVRWMNACDVFTLPSLSEGNPTVMFEALGFGKPFIGTRVGGVPEVITSDEYGLLVEPGSSSDLSEKLLLAVSRQWDREAILRYAQQFTWENISKRIVLQYVQALAQSEGGVKRK